MAVPALALVLWGLYGSTAVNQDTIVLLDWGRDLAGGRIPDYASTFSPTPHPLSTLLYGGFSLLGEDTAFALTVAFAYLSLAALAVLVGALARELAGLPAGVLAAALTLTSAEIVWRGIIGQQDVLAAALVLGALLIEVRRPRAGAPVLVLLAAAGLVRPEAWLLSAVYWLFVSRGAPTRTRLGLGALAASAPLLWATTDLLAAGDPLFSARMTRGGAEELGRVTGLSNVPGQLQRGLESVLGIWFAAGGLVGLALAVRGRMTGRGRSGRTAPSRPAMMAGALLLGWVAAFALLGAARLSLNARYLFVPSVLLCAYFAVAALGWTRLGPGRGRRTWMVAGGLLLAVAGVQHLPEQLDRISLVRQETLKQGRAIADLRSLAASGARPCSPLLVPNAESRAWVAWAFDLDRRQVVEPGERLMPRSFIAPRGADADALLRNRFFRPAEVRHDTPPGMRPGPANDSWILYGDDCRRPG